MHFPRNDYKRGVQLQMSLLPKADIHRRGQIQELQRLVSELKVLTEQLNLDLGDSEGHRSLGQKGILPAGPKGTLDESIRAQAEPL
jgi:hypothetical protein